MRSGGVTWAMLSLFPGVCCTAGFEYTPIRNLDDSLLAQQTQIEAALTHRAVVVEVDDLESMGRAIINTLGTSGQSLPAIRMVDSEDVNAFTLPNGDIYLNAALVVRLNRSEDLAFVLLHEWAHHLKGDLRRKLSMVPGSDSWQSMELAADQQALSWMQGNQWSTDSVAELIQRLYQSAGPRMLSLQQRLDALPTAEPSSTQTWQAPDPRLNSLRVMALELLMRRGSLGGLDREQAMAVLLDGERADLVALLRQTTRCADAFRQAQSDDERRVVQQRLDRWQAQSDQLADRIPQGLQTMRRRQGTPTLPVNYQPTDRLVLTARGPQLDALVIEPLNAPEPLCQASNWESAAIAALRHSHRDHALGDVRALSRLGQIELEAHLTDSAGLNWRVSERLLYWEGDWFRLRQTVLVAIDEGRPLRTLQHVHERLMPVVSGLNP